ncbi:FHA domain-containing protein [Candidatus Calescamantes bacterium]|nr:FHA domain-containing protein [Candidatus Calescamantes bacterium]
MNDEWNEQTNITDGAVSGYTPKGYIFELKSNRKIILGRKRFVIGRAPGCDLVLDDDSISRIHCAIHDNYSSFILEDMDSSNGTFINDLCIKKKILHSGDSFRIGDQGFSFHLFDNDPK